MATRLRFVSSAGVVRLDLNSATGFALGRGLDIGIPELRRGWLFQDGVDGSLAHSESIGPATMVVPIFLRTQVTAAAMKTLLDTLNVELNRRTNILEYQPDGWSTTYFLDTYRASLAAMHRGGDGQSPFMLLRSNEPVTLAIARAPYAGSTVAGIRNLIPV